MLKHIPIFVILAMVSLPAAAQLAATDTCTGQPSITDSTVGSSNPIVINGNRATYNDTFDTNDASCKVGPSNAVDSVFCITPASTCTPTVSLFVQAGNFGSINLVQGACPSSGVGACLGSTESNQASQQISLSVQLTGGVQYCYIGQSSKGLANTEDYTLTNSQNCGTLPVEIQEFSIESGTSEGKSKE